MGGTGLANAWGVTEGVATGKGLALCGSNYRLPRKNSHSGLPACPAFQEMLEILSCKVKSDCWMVVTDIRYLTYSTGQYFKEQCKHFGWLDLTCRLIHGPVKILSSSQILYIFCFTAFQFHWVDQKVHLDFSIPS